jgi:pimeloyl-ACP methyl ester carboxylesterase
MFLRLALLALFALNRATQLTRPPTAASQGGKLFHVYENAALFGSDKVKMRYTMTEPPPGSVATAPVVCVHGFGGNADQWRKNTPVLSLEGGHRTYAIDLLGYGYSDKPDPRLKPVNSIYNFENWADQTVDFIRNVVKEPVYLVSNSVGGCVALQAAVTHPELVKGVVLIDISLRMLHVKKQNVFIRPFVKVIQNTLRETPLGEIFFKQVAEKQALKNVLEQAYAGQVDDETVDLILQPGLQPGAAPVFLDFISYSGGPLPEELLAKCTRPVRILWGERDPWEPIDMGRDLAKAACVDEFVVLKNGGHCPMDQVPDQVNAELLRFLKSK